MKIEYRFNADSLFGGGEDDDTNVEESCDKYAEMVLEALEKAFPGAEIEVSENVSISGRGARVDYGMDEDTAEAVADIAEDIWSDMQWVVSY